MSINNSPIDEIQNKTPEIEQNTSGRTEENTDDITGTVDEQNPEDNNINDAEDTVEDTESRITGEATGRPSNSNLP